jgi:hypothetical protein
MIAKCSDAQQNEQNDDSQLTNYIKCSNLFHKFPSSANTDEQNSNFDKFSAFEQVHLSLEKIIVKAYRPANKTCPIKTCHTKLARL